MAGAHGQHAVGERRVHLVAVDVAGQRHAVLEAADAPGQGGRAREGGVEGEAAASAAANLVPVPKVASLKELNDLLEDACFAELERRIQGRAETVGEALRLERRTLRELPFEDFDCPAGAYALQAGPMRAG